VTGDANRCVIPRRRRGWSRRRRRAAKRRASYTWGIEIECFLPHSKVQELGISVGSYPFGELGAGHHGHPLPYPFPQGWTAERDGSLRTDRRGYVAVEIVSPILKGHAGPALAERATEVAKMDWDALASERTHDVRGACARSTCPSICQAGRRVIA